MMETRANYILVGFVTVAVLLASFGFVYWIARFGDAQDSVALEIKIPGSVTGLGVGSSVLFNGIKVGDVKSLTIDALDPKSVIAITQVKITTPVSEKTQATLGFVGLTGAAYIELKGGDPFAMNILQESLKKNITPKIKADTGAVNNLINQAQNIATKADMVFTGLQSFVQNNQRPLSDTIAHVEKFSKALGENSDQINTFLVNVGELSTTLKSVSGQINTTMAQASTLLSSIDTRKIDAILKNSETASAHAAEVTQDLKILSTSLTATLQNIEKLSDAANPEQISSAVASISSASQFANQALGDIAKLSQKIGTRGEEIDQIIRNTQEMTQRLNQASGRVDDVLKRIASFIGTETDQGPGLAAIARDTLHSYKNVADTLNDKMGTITSNLEKFSTRGLSGVDALIQDTRRSVSRIEQAISEFEKNPQKLIFGGSDSVPRYDDKNRR